ncbi:MAG: HD domain-containing protein [Bacilli bacterium]|nr:HD domain-containing protein [Bacilli bacterium]
MVLEQRVKEFGIKAHRGQVRKSEPDKPMIIHPINAANILREYGFDENVIAAGYLHDVVEDTKYEEEDIKQEFGEDIASLVIGATEPDKSLSWKARKEHTIETVKKLDLRHKAVVCADKISNLEDLRILIGKDSNYNFSAFRGRFDDQKWYYENVYKSLISNEDENLPMFIRLRELIDHVFNKITNDDYVKNKIFGNNLDEYNELIKLHYKKQEIRKLKDVISDNTPYIIEFTGTPRTGKTTLINNLLDFFKKGGFNVEVLEEFTTSKKYKKEIYPLLKDNHKNIINTEIPKYILKQLEDAIAKKPDIIIVDRSLFDRLIWVDRLFLNELMGNEEYQNYKNLYLPLIKEKINIVISTYTDSLTALKRDYNANLSLEKRNFLNEENVNEYNRSLLNMKEFSSEEKINFHLFDTTVKNERQISIEVADTILDDIIKLYIKKVQDEFK